MMSMASERSRNTLMEKVVRERKTEELVRAKDTSDIVAWIHQLEDDILERDEKILHLESELEEYERIHNELAGP